MDWSKDDLGPAEKPSFTYLFFGLRGQSKVMCFNKTRDLGWAVRKAAAKHGLFAVRAYAIKSNFWSETEAIEWLLRRWLHWNLRDDGFYEVNVPLFAGIGFVMKKLNEGQRPDFQAFEHGEESMFPSITGHESASRPFKGQLEEVLLHYNDFQFCRANLSGELDGAPVSIEAIAKTVLGDKLNLDELLRDPTPPGSPHAPGYRFTFGPSMPPKSGNGKRAEK